jgi:hypothetical protein
LGLDNLRQINILKTTLPDRIPGEKTQTVATWRKRTIVLTNINRTPLTPGQPSHEAITVKTPAGDFACNGELWPTVPTCPNYSAYRAPERRAALECWHLCLPLS